MKGLESSEQIKLLEKWQRRIRAAHKAHYYDASKLNGQHQKFGITVVVLSTLVGTSVFTSLAMKEEFIIIQIITGLLSIAATIFASLQTFLNYTEKKTAHLIASTDLSSLKKKIEEVIANEDDVNDLKLFIHDVRNEWDSITRTAPLLTQNAFYTEIENELNDSDFEI